MTKKNILTLWASMTLLLALGSVAQAQPEAVPGEYIVKFKGTAKLKGSNIFRTLGAQNVRAVNKEERTYVVQRDKNEAPVVAMSTMISNREIEFVEPNYIYRANLLPNDPMLAPLWGLMNNGQKIGENSGRMGIDIGAERAWDIQTGNKNVIVAVIDTGVDYTHNDLKNNMWVNEAEASGTAGVDDDNNGFVDDIHGINAINNSGNPMDDHGHGSHCSGTIAGVGNDGKGIVGVAWNARIMGVKFLSAEGGGTLENAIKGIDYAAKMGAQIMSNSWGGGGISEALKQAIVRARDKGILFVAAAGNDGQNIDEKPSYPASYDVANVLTVAAIDNTGALAYFSNYGAKTVEVAAPGVDITSSIPGNKYDAWSGTSMATPHVSGVAVLMLSQDRNLSYSELIERVKKSAVPLAQVRSKVTSRGMVNAFYALTNQAAPPDLEDPFNWEAKDFSFSTQHPYKENASLEFEVSVPGASSVSVYFERFDVERGFDMVEFVDASGNVVGKWTGKHDDEFSPIVSGSYMKVRFKADHIVNEYGFDAKRVAYK